VEYIFILFLYQKKIYIYFIFFGWKSSVIFLNELKPNLVIMHLKAILIQIIQTTSNAENHFYINVSKHKSIMFNSLLIKINFLKLNSIKFNYFHRITKHTLYLFFELGSFTPSNFNFTLNFDSLNQI
jgi:hypothetical protein